MANVLITFIGHKKNQACSCYKKKSCCRGATPKTTNSIGYNIYELVSKPPVKNCTEAGFILSKDGSMCCPSSCVVNSKNYCGVETDCFKKINFGMCCKKNLQKNCKDHGPPCLI